MSLKRIAFFILPLFLRCSASKCDIPFLRDYIQDNGKNECKFRTRDCPTARFSDRIDNSGADDEDLAWFHIVCIALMCFLLPLIVIATFTDIIHRYSAWKGSERESSFWHTLMIWSLYTNTKSLLKSKGGTFQFLNGMRVLCAYWVLLGHTFCFPVALDLAGDKSINIIKEFRKSNAWTPIENFTVSVDTFFHISGFLLFHSMWKILKRENGKMNIPRFILRKYWRLMNGMVVLLMCATIFYLLRSDMCFFNFMLLFKDKCSHYLWRNLLCIQHYFAPMDMCGPHAWFIAMLLLYHILGVLLVYLIYWNRKTGIAAGMILLVLCNVTTYVILRCNIHKFEDVEKNERFYLMKYENCRITVYLLPCDHFGPYWLGIMTGWLLENYNYCVVKKKFQWGAWAISVTCLVSTVFSCHLQNTTDYLFIYESLHRTVWGIGLTWVTYTCARGKGGILNNFLSWRPFLIAGEVAYLFYIVHPFIILKDYCQHKGNYPFQVPYWIHRSMVTTAISFCIAFFFHVTFERPTSKWI